LILSESVTVKQEGGRNPTVAVCPRSGTVYLAWAQEVPGTAPKDTDGKKADPRLEVRVARSGDRFKISGCPDISPGLAVDSRGRLHAAWYTGSERHPGVFYARSEDEGKGFSEPIALLSDDWIPYGDVKLAFDTRDNAWVAFEDRRGDEDLIQVARIGPDGRATLAQAWPGTGPDVAAEGETTIVAWGTKGQGDEEAGGVGSAHESSASLSLHEPTPTDGGVPRPGAGGLGLRGGARGPRAHGSPAGEHRARCPSPRCAARWCCSTPGRTWCSPCRKEMPTPRWI